MARAELVGDNIVVDTQWTEKELIKQVPGARWHPDHRVWVTPLTWTHCVMLRGVFGEQLEVGPKLVEWAWPVAMEMGTRREMRDRLEPPRRRSVDLYPFQEAGVEFLVRTKETLLGDEMGTGKTVQVCASLDQVTAYPALVICPNSVKRSWANHVAEWTHGGVPFVVGGGAATREKIIKAAADEPRAVVIVNYESLRTLTRLAPYGSTSLRRCRECDRKKGEEGLRPTQCQVHPKILNSIPFRTVIIDEAHKIKNPQAQQTRAVWAMCHGGAARYRWALTGTPIANHPGDLWSILHAISPNDFPTKTHYVDRYCLQSWTIGGGLEIVGLNPANREEFYSLLDTRFRRMRKDVVLAQLPPKVRTQRWVEMSPKQRRMYDEFETALQVRTDAGGVINALDHRTAKLRQLQLSSASVETIEHVILEDDETRLPVRMIEPSPKLDALEDILDELGDRPVAVCAHHRQLIDLAAKRLTKAGITHGLITGGVSVYERDKALRDFQEGRVRVLLFTIAAGGTGLTMTAADTLVFLQRSWSMVDNKQAEDRVHRIGSEVHEAINIIDIVTQDSVEEGQIQSLLEKMQRLEEITRDRAHGGVPSLDLDLEEDRILRSEIL